MKIISVLDGTFERDEQITTIFFYFYFFDGRMCEICDPVDKVGYTVTFRLKLSELESRQDRFEGAIVNMCN